jgi:hypothetical protein
MCKGASKNEMQRSFMVNKTQGAEWIVRHSSLQQIIGSETPPKYSEPDEKLAFEWCI